MNALRVSLGIAICVMSIFIPLALVIYRKLAEINNIDRTIGNIGHHMATGSEEIERSRWNLIAAGIAGNTDPPGGPNPANTPCVWKPPRAQYIISFSCPQLERCPAFHRAFFEALKDCRHSYWRDSGVRVESYKPDISAVLRFYPLEGQWSTAKAQLELFWSAPPAGDQDLWRFLETDVFCPKKITDPAEQIAFARTIAKIISESVPERAPAMVRKVVI